MTLSLGIGLGLTMQRVGAFSPSSLFASGEGGAWYDPSDLSTLWQDSARTTPVTSDGDPVGAIDDKSGNGNHALQAITDARPLYKTSGGLHWLLFDGGIDVLVTANLSSYIMNGGGMLSAVMRSTLDESIKGVFEEVEVATSSNRIVLYSDTRTAINRFCDYAADGTDRYIDYPSKQGLTDRVAILNSDGTIATGYSDGVSLGTLSSTSDFDSGTVLKLGIQTQGAGRFVGRMYGAIARDTVSSTDEVTSVNSYLSDKAGL